MTLLDKYSKPLNIGTKVAFNLSGNVCIGVIKKISPRKQYGKAHDPYTKEPYVSIFVSEIKAHPSAEPSKVQNVGGIISLE